MAKTMVAKERLYLTADKKALVAAGDKRGATLYAVPGDEIPDSAVQKFGLIDGGIKGSKDGAPPANKGGKPPANKGKPAQGDKDKTPEPDELTKIKGIGEASAKALAAAGIDSFAKLVEVDPANPPEIDGLAGRVTWDVWVNSAKLLDGPRLEGRRIADWKTDELIAWAQKAGIDIDASAEREDVVMEIKKATNENTVT